MNNRRMVRSLRRCIGIVLRRWVCVVIGRRLLGVGVCRRRLIVVWVEVCGRRLLVLVLNWARPWWRWLHVGRVLDGEARRWVRVRLHSLLVLRLNVPRRRCGHIYGAWRLVWPHLEYFFFLIIIFFRLIYIHFDIHLCNIGWHIKSFDMSPPPRTFPGLVEPLLVFIDHFPRDWQARVRRAEPPRLCEQVEKPKAVFVLTHAHTDHIQGITDSWGEESQP